MGEFLNELMGFVRDVASGSMDIDEARQRAAELQARQPEQMTDALLAELDAKIAELD